MIGRIARIIEENVPPIEAPRRDLEQYTTPADMSAFIAVHALNSGILEGARAADLAAGTCRLCIALLLLGAASCLAVDVDSRLPEGCYKAASRLGLAGKIDYVVSRIGGSRGPLSPGSVEIIVTNPPFGVWRRGADWEILEYALSLSPLRVYAILKQGNIEFHERRARSHGYRAILLSTGKFPIRASMPGHRSRVRWIGVDIVVFDKA